MAALDFGELGSGPVGENLEGLVRLIRGQLGLTVARMGRGDGAVAKKNTSI